MRTVLFVCVHNAGRSQMAEAMLRSIASAQGVDVQTNSAGTVGGKDINPTARQAMEEIGISMQGQRPKLLTQEMADGADLIISMGCGVDAEACPAKFLLTEDWQLDDPAGQSIERVREIRDRIRDKVEVLVKSLRDERV